MKLTSSDLKVVLSNLGFSFVSECHILLTGRAWDIVVASNAAAKLLIARHVNAAQKNHLELSSSVVRVATVKSMATA